METADQVETEAGEDGTVLDREGLRSELLLVGIILTVYLVGVATDRDGRKI